MTIISETCIIKHTKKFQPYFKETEEKSLIIQSERVWLSGQFSPAQIEITGSKVTRVIPFKAMPADLDFGAKRIVPGFLDIHTHGAYGFDTNDADPEGLRNWSKRIPEEGVTAFCPTTVTQSDEQITAALRNAAQVMADGYTGAEILGIHLEGPFLSKEYKGAHPEQYVVPASIDKFQQFWEAANGKILMATLAPEADPDYALTRHCVQRGVVVSMGHSGASYEQALLCAANGAASMTHVYNGMAHYQNRNPGMVGAAFRLDGVYGEVIGDGIHVSLVAANNLFQAKGPERMVMITDSLHVKGCPAGTYYFAGNEINVCEEGGARLKSGLLAGSTLKMNHSLRNMTDRAMVPFTAALNACTINPARLLRIDDRKGKIGAGYDADLVVLEDDYDVLLTFCRGEIIYHK